MAPPIEWHPPQENIMYRTQQIHFEMAHALASIATMCALPIPFHSPVSTQSK